MSKFFNIAFADIKGELSWFALSPDAIKSFNFLEKKNDSSGKNEIPELSCYAHDSQDILILPATAGLPFQIELSFDDETKISRVIPQFVADQYSEVRENWLFSWALFDVSTDEKKAFLASGIAFPPEFNPDKIGPAINWRLAVPDSVLLEVSYGQAINITTPANSYLGIFSRGGCLARIVVDPALPVAPLLSASGITEIVLFDCTAEPAKLFKRIVALVDESHNHDLSGFQQHLFKRSLKISAIALISLLLGLIGISHFFLWFEGYLAESAAERTRISTAEAFNKVFPVIPVVDAASQIRRKISEAENSLKEAGSVPNIDWLSIMICISKAGESNIKISKLNGRINGFLCQGEAPDFTSLEAFRKNLEENPEIEKVLMPESRKNSDVVLFTLEVSWKK